MKIEKIEVKAKTRQLKATFIDVNTNINSYSRELWCVEQKKFIKYNYNLDISYDYNGRIVHWVFPEGREIEAEQMATIWSLEDQGYRTSFQKGNNTFFWVDDNFYKKNKKQILEWTKNYKCHVPSIEYGWIQVPNEKVEMLFRLRWAGKCYK